jgi:gas vesicle protein GvpL/GvpF
MVCAEVPHSAYGAASIEEGLRDLDWVARVAVAHEAVVERFTRVNGATVIPMKLLTIFSDETRAREAMSGRRRDLDLILKRIKGCQEWGVRVTRRPGAGVAAPRTAAKSGAAFLAAKKQARDAARDQLNQAGQAADEAYRALARLARTVRRRQAPEAATTPPILDAAFLVLVTRRAQFKSAAARAAAGCAMAGAELTLTGPWPAYHFVQDGDASS